MVTVRVTAIFNNTLVVRSFNEVFGHGSLNLNEISSEIRVFGSSGSRVNATFEISPREKIRRSWIGPGEIRTTRPVLNTRCHQNAFFQRCESVRRHVRMTERSRRILSRALAGMWHVDCHVFLATPIARGCFFNKIVRRGGGGGTGLNYRLRFETETILGPESGRRVRRSGRGGGN